LRRDLAHEQVVVHGCTRLAAKLDFISGLLLKATEAAGTRDASPRADSVSG
jgi:hypothetical protein